MGALVESDALAVALLLVAAAASVVGVCAHRLRARLERIELTRAEVLKRLALAAEYRDDETLKHARRIARSAGLLAEGLGLGAHDVWRIRHAAMLHDIGKIAIPDAVLLKPGPLSPDEFAHMRRHTTIGAELLAGSGSSLLDMAAEIALTHHERWDGGGYPHGLRGEAIPLVGRIVAVADVFDALTHRRPYKPAWPLSAALFEIEAGSGSDFDPAVVAAFRELPHHQLVDVDVDDAGRRPVAPLLNPAEAT